MAFLTFKATTRDIEIIRRRGRHIAGAQVTVAQQEEGPPTGAPINIEISGNDFARLGALAEQIRAVVEKNPHVEDVRDDFVGGLPSVRVRIARLKTWDAHNGLARENSAPLHGARDVQSKLSDGKLK